MSYMNQYAFADASGIRDLSLEEIDAIAAAGELGENVLLFGGAGGAIGAFAGPKGAAVGILIGAAVGGAVTVLDDD